MKNILIGFLFCTLAFLCTSCFREVNLGFPGTVTFSKEGGTKTVTGDAAFTSADIHDYKTGEQELYSGPEYHVIKVIQD